MLAMGRARVAGDYLQTAAIFDEEMNVLSKITDPNDYQGPGTGYEVSAARRTEIAGIRQQRSKDDFLHTQASWADHVGLVEQGEAGRGSDPREVCVGVSPALATKLWMTMSGLPVGEVLRQIVAGLEDEGCMARLVRVRSTIDLGMIGLTAARLAGSGIGIGLQAKGTVLIHRRDLPPLACLELYSIAPLITKEMYRALGANAGRHAKGMRPIPARNPYTDQAIEARYHADGRGAGGDRARRMRTRRGAREPASDEMTALTPSPGARSRRSPSRLALRGDLSPDDLRIHPDTLRHQALVAEQHGNRSWPTTCDEPPSSRRSTTQEVLAIYEALRPGRASLGRARAHRTPSRSVGRTPVRGAGERGLDGLRATVDCTGWASRGALGSAPGARDDRRRR